MQYKFFSLRITHGYKNFFKKFAYLLLVLIVIILLIRMATGIVTSHNLARTVKKLEIKWKSLDPASLAPPAVPDSQNAAKFYKAALELLFLEEEDANISNILWKSDPIKELEKENALGSLLQKNQMALELIDRGTDLPLSNWKIPYKDGIEAELPRLLPIMKLSRLLTLKALSEILGNKPEMAAKTLATGFSFSGSMKNEPSLMVQHARMSMNQNFILALREMLARNEPSGADLVMLQKIAEESYSPDPVHQGFLFELKGWYLLHKKIENGRYMASEDQQSFLMLKAFLNWLLLPVARSDTNFYISHMDQLISYNDLPRYQRVLKYEKTPVEDKPYFFQTSSKLLLPINESSILRGDLAKARSSIAALAIALRRFRIANGSYPDSLEELAPGFISQTPIDPFSGKPFFYAREGKGFSLQSEGDNPRYTTPSKMDKVLKWKIEK